MIDGIFIHIVIVEQMCHVTSNHKTEADIFTKYIFTLKYGGYTVS